MKRIAIILFMMALTFVLPGFAEDVTEIPVEIEAAPVAGSIAEIGNDSGAAGEIYTFPSTMDESTLAEKYINASLPQKRTVLRVSRPSGLIKFAANTANRNLYLALREKITAVANGTASEETDSISTVFSISATDIFPSTKFTAEDLGVEALFNDEGQVKWQASEAFWEKIDALKEEIAFGEVALCIINDSPYELYWFGLSAQVLEVSFKMMQYSDHSALLLRGTYDVVFSVSQDYAVIPDGWDKQSLLSEIDKTKYGSVTRARETINAIRSSVNGMDDEQMMRYFADWICSHVSYHWDAVNEYREKKRGYGDPWQLVWVFDQKSGQKVVCEGYAKAFAYLCELCTSEAEAIIVWGNIQAGAHMWNIVNFEGHNYLVDLTNHTSSRDLYLVGGDGSVEDGYWAGGIYYKYNRNQTTRSDEELMLASYSYAEWKEATAAAPIVKVSSDRTYPGCLVAVEVESSNGKIPVDGIVVIQDEEKKVLDGDTVLLEFSEDTELKVSAVVDGITTPEMDAGIITVAELLEVEFMLPYGSTIESEAFSGVNVEFVRLHGNTVAEDAFEDTVVLGVDEIADWFESGYRFVICPADS